MYYNSTTSSFVCPKNATYLVSAAAITTDAQTYQHFWLLFFKGSDVIVKLQNSGALDPGNTISNSVVLECQEGQTLTLKGQVSDGYARIKGDVNIPYTTFTAFMITGQYFYYYLQLRIFC